MIITNETPIIKEATKEVVFNGFWASRVIVNTPSPLDKGSVTITLKPYNSTTQETLNTTETITVSDVWAAAKDTPEVGIAIMSLIHAIDILRKKKAIEDAALAAKNESERIEREVAKEAALLATKVMEETRAKEEAELSASESPPA